ncbi:anthrone oxygenase family protein [Puerhibacterium sp. TATVAM-FAB25]|uniref:anthrone oxygenase family protein n=1 Tax=Puerhibacterium sp. TATVAM-FAB25 TaxID=3093699 RepID=UPI00397B51EE
METLVVVLLALAAVGAGLAAGVFFAFSGFVLQGLELLPAPAAARAMRSINVTATRPPLMVVLFGTALLGVVVAVVAVVDGSGGAGWAVAGAAVYLVTVVGVTAAANVPRNTALAATPAQDEALARAWWAYRPGWAAWNHVRTAGGAVAAALFVVALVTAGGAA